MLAGLARALRPHQWVKNLLVFAGAVFAHRLGDRESVLAAVLAFVVFCMVSSAVYLLNDVIDREADRRHPVKRTRPIASGQLPATVALGVSAALLVGGLGLAGALGDPSREVPFATWPAAYLLLQAAYSFGLKALVIVDCICIALGFALRVHAGAAVLPGNVPTSSWILLCTFFFSLFLAFCKRREELVRTGNGSGTRASLRHYDLGFLDQVIAPLAALSILSYALWTTSERAYEQHRTHNLILTLPFVVYGVFRYLFLVYRRAEGGDPARLLFQDRGLIASGILFGLAVWWILGSVG